MSIPLQYLVLWLTRYRYALIFPLAIVEGPVIMVLSGFLASVGVVDFFVAYILVVLGDIVADAGYYALGRYAGLKLPPRVMHFFGLKPARVATFAQHFKAHPKKIFTLGKLSYGIGVLLLFVAGVAEFPFWQFLLYNLVITLVKSLLLLLAGYYFGQAYTHVTAYVDYVAIITSVLLVVGYFAMMRYMRARLDEEDGPPQV